MSGEAEAIPPPIMWTQRANCIFLTVCLEDCKSPEIRLEPQSVYFKGIGGTEKKHHEITIPLYKEIDPEKSAKFVRDRNIEFVLKKKEEGPYWPQLTKEKKKYHWLKVDFNKWKDEDDSEDEFDLGGGQSGDLEEMMRSMGGLGGGDTKPNFDVDVESDSDDEDLPDLVE